jgi:hypothetical protein
MCIAILNSGKRIAKAKLSNSWNNNDDGAGMLYVADGKLIAEKFPNQDVKNSSKNFEKFYKRYVEVYDKHGELPMLIHFRIATHGLTPEYLHPFFVSDSVGFVHNGIIYGLGSHERSDTAEFADLLSTIHVPSVATLDNPFIEESISRFIETDNKLIFLDNTGDYRIFNEDIGEWVEGNWYSNKTHSYKPLKKFMGYGDYGYYGGFGTATAKGKTESAYATKYDDNYWQKLEDNRIMYPYESYSADDYDYDAPFLDTTYKCNGCQVPDAQVNYNSECLDCYSYIHAAADAVIDKLGKLEPKGFNASYKQ